MVSCSDIRRAADLINDHIIRTPLVYSPTFSDMSGVNVYLKLETLQRAGSFKIRGAMNKVLLHKAEIGTSGVITASAGNHAQGVALAAHTAGIPATIVMPEGVPISKQEAVQGYGAEIITSGKDLQESVRHAKELGKRGQLFIHPFDDPEVIAGQGTIALEIFEDIRDPDVIIAPVGGGGLISGIAVGAKELNPGIRMIGVQAAACPAAYNAYYSGEDREFGVGRSIADGILVKYVGTLTLPLLRKNVDEMVLVKEDQIADAMFLLLERKKVVAEGAGAAPLAALLSGALSISPDSNVVLVISGGNVDGALLSRILRRGLLKSGRIMRISVYLEDIPGSLANILNIIAHLGGNILQVNHVHSGQFLPVSMVQVDIELETRAHSHIAEIQRALIEKGYKLDLK